MKRRDFLAGSSLMTGLLAAGALPAVGSPGLLPETDGGGSGETPLLPVKGARSLDRARWVPGALASFHFRSAETGGAFSLIEARGVPGMEPGPHTHTHEDETIYLMDGRMWFRIGDEEFELGPGEAIFMPRLVEHEFKILSKEMHVLLLINPGDFGDYFWKFSAPAKALEIPPPPEGPPPPEQLEAMRQALREYGIKSAM